MTTLTNQEIFDRTINFMKAQGKPAVAGFVCKYLTTDGHRCAAGCHFKDDPGTNEMAYILQGSVHPESGSIGYRPAEQLLNFQPEGNQLTLLSMLQNAHDTSANSSNFVKSFLFCCRIIAEDFNLDPKLCEE